MKKIAMAIMLAICALSAAYAQQPEQRGMSDEDREKWLNELRNYKHDVLARELKLSREQQAEFFPIYDEMDDELNQISTDTRELEAKVYNDPDASDLECETAARALFEQKSREGEVETAYFDKFKEILSPKQLIRLKNAERKFTQQLVRQHGRNRSDLQRRKQ